MFSNNTDKPIKIWTDGSCLGNPGPGGWGVLMEASSGERHEISGAQQETTNNRMELLAAISALEALTQKHGRCHVILHTDSTYVKDGLNKWMVRWKAKGWKASTGKAVKNQDLWKRLDLACAAHRMEWRWIRGHSGDAGNEHVDRLANNAARKISARKP